MASNYNSRVRPAEVMIIDGQAHLIKARETFEDLMVGQIELDTFAQEKTDAQQTLVPSEV
jgi:diaminopimelate decarboxylase